ncbi:MAG TPA: hypothetical protein VMT27_03090 [Actinomycetes bacterium]|nr:hypothetical protein [Actinomycetes bacterium]
MTTIFNPGATSPVLIGLGAPPKVGVELGGTDLIEIEVGTSGKQGEPGPEGGTLIVPVPYDQWPPVDPQPDTLYLRLAP